MPVSSDKPTTRERLLQAALTCFADKGYHPTTTDEIVAESGLGKGTLYRYFKSKQDLFISLVEWFMLDMLAEVSQNLSPDMSATDKIRTMIFNATHSLEQMLPFYKVTIDFWAQATDDEQLRQLLETILFDFQEQLGQVIQEGVDSGEFRPTDPAPVALGLVAMVDALGLYATLLDHEIDLQQTVETTVDVFLAGLRAEGAA
jgi:AcrR family transcriptional regulator